MVGYHPASGYVQGINDLVTHPSLIVGYHPASGRTGHQRPGHTLLCCLPHRVHH